MGGERYSLSGRGLSLCGDDDDDVIGTLIYFFHEVMNTGSRRWVYLQCAIYVIEQLSVAG